MSIYDRSIRSRDYQLRQQQERDRQLKEFFEAVARQEEEAVAAYLRSIDPRYMQRAAQPRITEQRGAIDPRQIQAQNQRRASQLAEEQRRNREAAREAASARARQAISRRQTDITTARQIDLKETSNYRANSTGRALSRGLRTADRLLRAGAAAQAIQQRQESEDNGLLARAGRLAGSAINTATNLPGIGAALRGGVEVLDKPYEETMQTYHAARFSQLAGGSFGDQLLSAGLNVPGAGFVPDSVIGDRGRRLRRQSEAVNTREEREALRQQGQYASPGEFITGRAADVLQGDALAAYQDQYGDGILPSAVPSGLVDLVITVATDPLTYTPGVVQRAGLSRPTLTSGERALSRSVRRLPAEVQQQIAEAARDGFLRNTRRGRAIERETRRVAAQATDAGEAMRRLPGLAPTAARDIAGASTREAAQEIASRALRTGEYIPDISVRRQALLATTGRGLRAPGALGLGRRVVRESEGVFDFVGRARRLANNRPGRIAVTRTSSVAQARRATVKASLRRVGLRSGDAREMVAGVKVGLTPWDRINEALVDIDNLPAAVAEVVEGTLEGIVPKSTSPQDFSRKLANLDTDEKAMQALLEVETLIATARGDFGDEAAQQLLAELSVGFSRPREANVQQVVARAGNRAGLGKPKVKPFRKASKESFDRVSREIDNLDEPILKDAFHGALADVRKMKKGRADALTKLRQNVQLATKGDIAQDAAGMLARYGDILADRDSFIGLGRKGLGQKVNPARRLGQVVTSLTETISPHQLRFLSTENVELALQERVKAFDTYMGALGLSDDVRIPYRQAVAEVQTEADLYRLVDDLLSVMADAEGVPAEILSDMLTKTRGEAREMGFAVHQVGDEAGETINEVQNLSQLNEAIPLPDPVDVRRTIKELRKGMDDPDKLKEIRQYLLEPTDTRKIGRALSFVHRNWKLMVVTNLYMPVVGGFVGFVGTEGEFTDRLKGGFQWAAIGALAPSRYILRIGIEESARRLLMNGLTPTDFIPAFAKWRVTHGVTRPLMSPHLLSAGDPTGSWIRNETFDRATGEFAGMALPNQDSLLPIAKLSRRNARYLNSWDRIINNEINDANGALDRILLGRKAGHITQKEADTLIGAFLKSHEGQVWWRRWKSAYGAPGSKKEAVQRQVDFIDKYVPEDVARVRLPAMDADFQKVPTSLLKAKVKDGSAPAFIHAEKTWTLPRRKTWFQDVGTIKNQITDKLIFGGPTRTVQRRPLARKAYKDEYLRLTRAGIAPERAQQLADRKAINLVNDVMFNQNNESRFAQKVDIVFPFQQPREELVRVWLPLAFNNKIRTLHVTALGAKALEAGAASGMFYEYTNPFTGEKEWRMKIPGSATLSRALGGVNADFDFGLRDILFISQDNMGATLGIPSPGGPFWTVFTRNYINAFPEHYDALPDSVKEYLFPFGQSGRLGRNEANRLWMSFMGTPAPWEFANQWEQQEEYRKVQVNMFLHLYQQNLEDGKTGEAAYPTFEQVDEATKAYLRTQATIGAIWPAPARYVQPWEELVTKAQEPYLDKDGNLDYYAFIEDFPQYAPFITRRKKFVGPDTLKNWSRSDEETAEDYIKHWSETVTVREFKEELENNRLTAEAWRERNQIQFKYNDWELPDAYAAWEAKWLDKHPEVVEQSRNNYFRDRDLNRIMHMAGGSAKDRALDSWRKKYNVSGSAYSYHVERLEREGWKVDYWKASRPTDIVLTEVRKEAKRQGVDEEVVVRLLNPAEQVKYWKAQQADLAYFNGEQDPQVVIDTYYIYGDRVRDLYAQYPGLSGGGGDGSVIEKYIENWRGNTREQLAAVYAEIDVVSARFNELDAKGEGWSEEGQALYQKRSNLYDLAEHLKNKQFQELPGLLSFVDDVFAATALMREGKPTKASMEAFANLITRPIGRGGFVPSNEELTVLNMPKEVREGYTDRLIGQLDMPAVKGLKGKLYWEWLTDFQKDYLKRNVPVEKLQDWMAVSPDDAIDPDDGQGGEGDALSVELEWAYEMFRRYNKRPEDAQPPTAYEEYLRIRGNGKEARAAFLDAHPEVEEWISLGPMANMPDHIRISVHNIMVRAGKWDGEIITEDDNRGYGRGGRAAADPELAFAYEMFKQYSQRPEGATPPAAYQEYLNLPANPMVRNQFLEQHPEVADWIAAGPMANMPEHLRFIVQNIMVKHGKWEGEIVDATEINDLAFAREQLNRWNLRGDMKRPATYDLWLAMPSGVEKANYLKAHPEIQEWLKLGPMSNMPDAYQDVVRDIMLRYGQWTQEGDALGQVIAGYYKTPLYARDQYLEEHPELEAYWAAIRTPEEKRMGQMVDQYFSIRDPYARMLYMGAHPELEQYFIHQRNERYERFLNQVAVYMGQHPQLFMEYLDRQEDVMNDLMLRYAEPPLLREIPRLEDRRQTERQRRRGG